MRKVDVLVCLNAADGKSRTQEQILLTLKQVIKAAISDKYITPGIYPELFDGIKIKRVKKTDKRPLTELERKAVFSADFTDMQRAFVYIIYGCGLRRGEALALTRSDFDFKSKKLKVNKSLAFDKNEPYIKSTKSQNGIREVPVPAVVFPFLHAYCQNLKHEQLFRTAGNVGFDTPENGRARSYRPHLPPQLLHEPMLPDTCNIHQEDCGASERPRKNGN